jgi:hypothetical protein
MCPFFFPAGWLTHKVHCRSEGKAEERGLDRRRVNEVIEDVMEITRALYDKGNDSGSCDER